MRRPIMPFCAGPGASGGPGGDEDGGDAGSVAVAVQQEEEELQPDPEPESQPEEESPHSREVGRQHSHLPMLLKSCARRSYIYTVLRDDV